jgi:hypothetical protein
VEEDESELELVGQAEEVSGAEAWEQEWAQWVKDRRGSQYN